MTSYSENINTLWGALIIEELFRNGVTCFFVSPGSRSAPLTISVGRHPQIKGLICNDERGAAFCALGYARAAMRPAALISTSGTAVANYFPAVIEASMDCIPLIVLSADRPPELLQTGANQAIKQPDIFGGYIRWRFDMPCPDEKIKPEMVLTTIDQAVYQALHPPAGPVHLNCMFREPLEPINQEMPKGYLSRLMESRPYTRYEYCLSSAISKDLQPLIELINMTRRGLIVAGRLGSEKEREAVIRLAERINWPFFADITSGLRTGCHTSNHIAYFDQILMSEKFIGRFNPEVILHLGGQVASKRFLQYLETHSLQNYILVEDNPFRRDPAHRVTWRLESGICGFCEALSCKINPQSDADWLSDLKKRSGIAGKTIDNFLKKETVLNEPAIARLVSQNIPAGHGLFLASSMPVRDMDMYADPYGHNVRVGSNRGCSGIDGTIASAAGYAIGTNMPLTLLIGDLAFLHDLNSLYLLKIITQQVIIILINNNGGGIFSFLPIAGFHDVFEAFFATPHTLTFKHAAGLFDIKYYQPSTCGDFLDCYKDAINLGKPAIIEIQTQREGNLALHKRLQKEIKDALEGV
ncbi:2-succinyl-5-enolpyruvyl-6-hydroxy-3-cyclohexene-1-carboxylic-acid synthase [bacterium]|nr:2-succinyl-5-enolpyruvyl-6-hydroxy-3-cyclohexene-1-carboxylic-acid synthase [bacterium]